MSKFTHVRELPSRRWAHPFDRPVKLDIENPSHGVDTSPDAIGGHYGIGWYEIFRDSRSGQIYTVHCSDGVNYGKCSHRERDEKWMDSVSHDIISRTVAQASKSTDPIVLSSNEWTLMLKFSFTDWLDLLPGEEFKTVGDRNRHLDEGQIGTINGVPVVVDPSARNGLKVGAHTAPIGSPRSALPRAKRATTHGPSRFSGVFADALRAAGVSC